MFQIRKEYFIRCTVDRALYHMFGKKYVIPTRLELDKGHIDLVDLEHKVVDVCTLLLDDQEATEDRGRQRILNYKGEL